MTSQPSSPRSTSDPSRMMFHDSVSTTPAQEREALDACVARLRTLRAASGLFVASPSDDYAKAWIRDNVYEAMPFLGRDDGVYESTYHALLDVLRMHEWKIDNIARQRPSSSDDYIHARFDAVTLREIEEPWGNKQNDATGALMWGIAAGLERGLPMLRDERDRRLVQKLIRMHVALSYWEDPDNGIWEEDEELHASSIGAVIAGLRGLRSAGFEVPDDAIKRGEEALARLLPREAAGKETDLALLTLVYPFRVVTDAQRDRILTDVETRLLRERGAIRYAGDSYYSKRATRHGRNMPRSFYAGSEAEWTFALPWLSIAWREAGDTARADAYLARSLAVMDSPGSVPELYYAGTDEPNPNTPLGWSIAMVILALDARAR